MFLAQAPSLIFESSRSLPDACGGSLVALPASGVPSLPLPYKLPSDRSAPSTALALSLTTSCSEILSGSCHTMTRGQPGNCTEASPHLAPVHRQTGPLFPFCAEFFTPCPSTPNLPSTFLLPFLCPYSPFLVFLIFFKACFLLLV